MRFISISLTALILASCGQTPREDPNPNTCAAITQGHISIKAAQTQIGSTNGYPEERVSIVDIEAFDIDRTEVTNAEFAKFVLATNYVTTAEKPQPGTDQAGGAVFMPPTPENSGWWHFTEGANWKHPEGPLSNIDGQDNFPVVQISLIDAKAYAKWANRALPTEAQWEYAARAGSDTDFVWGDELSPEGVEKANTWQGAFPIENTQSDGYEFRAPIGCYEPNDYGLYDMIGNVWEWTSTEYAQTRTPNSYTIKGGSFLCAPNYCARYRAPARQPQEADFSTNHIGFRTVSKPPTSN